MYQINAPTVISETLEGESVIINTVTGHYYTARGHASTIWDALIGATPVAAIAEAYADQGIFARGSRVIEGFVELLLTENLLAPSPPGGASAPPQLQIDPSLGNAIPTLSRHDDLHALIELDPIHEVSPQLGWPFHGEKPA